MNFKYVLGFVLLRDVVKVFPVSSPSFVSTLVDFDRTIFSTRKQILVKTNVSPLDADEALRAKRSS